MALPKIAQPKKYPSFQLGKKPIMRAAVKKPNMVMPRSVKPYGGPAPGADYGQNALYPGGYQGVARPVDWSDIFTNPGNWAYNAQTGGGGGGGGGGPTGGAGIIGGDWEVQDAEAAMAAGMARARGDFQAGLRQAFIDYGGGADLSKLGNLSKYLDTDTIKAAVANKYSQNAQIGQQAEKITAQTRARNAAMGRLSSGETTNRETEIAAQAEGNRYTALRDFLSGGAQGLMGLADREEQYASAVAQARAAAAMRAAETYPGAFAPDTNVYPNESGFYNTSAIRGTTRAPGPDVPGVSRTMLSQPQFRRKFPQGNYYNYMRAYYKRNPYARTGS